MDTRGNPWACYPADVGSIIKTDRTFVASFVWSGYTDSEHVAEIRDIDGRTVFVQRGNLEFEPVQVEIEEAASFLQMTLTQLDSGVLLIYIR